MMVGRLPSITELALNLWPILVASKHYEEVGIAIVSYNLMRLAVALTCNVPLMREERRTVILPILAVSLPAAR